MLVKLPEVDEGQSSFVVQNSHHLRGEEVERAHQSPDFELSVFEPSLLGVNHHLKVELNVSILQDHSHEALLLLQEADWQGYFLLGFVAVCQRHHNESALFLFLGVEVLDVGQRGFLLFEFIFEYLCVEVHIDVEGSGVLAHQFQVFEEVEMQDFVIDCNQEKTEAKLDAQDLFIQIHLSHYFLALLVPNLHLAGRKLGIKSSPRKGDDIGALENVDRSDSLVEPLDDNFSGGEIENKEALSCPHT